MPGKMVPCLHCSKVMRSDNLKGCLSIQHCCPQCNKVYATRQSLWRHKQKCGKTCAKKIYTNKLIAGSGYKWESGKLIHDSKNQSSVDCEFMESTDESIPKDRAGSSRSAGISQKTKNAIRLTLKWDGESWRSTDTLANQLYKVKLGRDIDNLLKKGAIREDVLSCRQIENLNMYRKLFE